MAKGKKTRTKEESLLQKHRTAKNQIKRFRSLLEEKPASKHAKVWTSKVDKYEGALK